MSSPDALLLAMGLRIALQRRGRDCRALVSGGRSCCRHNWAHSEQTPMRDDNDGNPAKQPITVGNGLIHRRSLPSRCPLLRSAQAVLPSRRPPNLAINDGSLNGGLMRHTVSLRAAKGIVRTLVNPNGQGMNVSAARTAPRLDRAVTPTACIMWCAQRRSQIDRTSTGLIHGRDPFFRSMHCIAINDITDNLPRSGGNSTLLYSPSPVSQCSLCGCALRQWTGVNFRP